MNNPIDININILNSFNSGKFVGLDILLQLYRVFHAKDAIINRWFSATRNDKVNLKTVLKALEVRFFAVSFYLLMVISSLST